ncbi:type II secretion system protein [Stutzerimonas stutzeri]|uniref:Type II secretion system protein n=1 Tax=Stutzerimonas stutzeri TaxID=316 RepID=A0A2N8T682_STUST|nr:type II secretion system protein [Stutzerimonas stutzeri]MCQ4325547.1 type II secretion system GspH family protein [Stutzerimonas stutzeri]PNG10233.1 type II secretion system protein [Stutzerimonas stutzeri]
MKVLSCRKSRQSGFTLVELIMVIALAGIVAVMISTVMSRPLQGFVDQSRRAELTDLAASALNRMARDIQLAVPNSVAVADSGDEIRFVSIAAAGRYRANQPDPDGPRQDPPACTQSVGSCTIDVLSPIVPVSSTLEHWLIIYNTEALIDRTEPTDGDVSAISPKVFTWADGVLSASLSDFRFKYASPQHRFFLANKVVGYRCSGGKLLRKEFSALDESDYSNASMSVNNVDCDQSSFIYEPANNTRNGLVTLKLLLTKGGETITLLQQVHVDNVP